MRLQSRIPIALFALSAISQAATFAVIGAQSGAWPAILSSVGHLPGQPASADILVAPPNTPASLDWKAKVENGATLILEGPSPLAASFGFRPLTETVSVVHLVDVHNPSLPVIWENAVDLPRYEIPVAARVFAKDRWTSVPLLAGLHSGAGAVLWVAASPGPNGYERFPYLLQALSDLGVEPAFRSSRLWAFFDYSYRARADPDYLADRSAQGGHQRPAHRIVAFLRP